MTLAASRRAWPARLTAFAERDPRRAGALARRARAAPGLGGGELLAIGWALLRWERLDEAAEALGAAIELLSPDTPEALRCRRALLMARQIGGAGAGLQAEWDDLADACAAAGQPAELAAMRCEQVAHLNLIGRPREALALAEASRELVARHGGPGALARYYHVAAAAASGCARLDEAHALIGRACAEFAQLRRPAEVARARFERSWLWQRAEQFDRAEEDIATALGIYRRLDMPLRIALCMRDLGLIARYRGDYGRAISLLVDARERFLQLGRIDRVADCDLNLATVAHVSGLHDLAIAAYRRAQHIYDAGGNRHMSLLCRRNEALALCRQGRPTDALALLDALLETVTIIGDQLELAEVLVARSQALRGLGQPATAIATLHDAHGRFMQIGNAAAAAECLLDIGWLHLDRGELPDARAYLRLALANLADRPAHRWLARYGLGRVAEQQGELADALNHYVAAVGVVSELRRRLASEHASSGIFSLASQLHADALRLAALRDDRALLLDLAERQRAMALQRQLADAATVPSPADAALRARAHAQLRAALRAPAAPGGLEHALSDYLAALLHSRHAAPRATVPAAQLDLAELRGQLSASFGLGWSVLLPIAIEEALLLVGITPEAILIDRTPLDAPLRDLIARAAQPRNRMATYRDLERLRDPRRPAWATLAALGERLIPAWLRPRLDAGHRLLIVPGTPLDAIAWAALRTEDAWLCERAVIQILPALCLPAPPAPPPGQDRALLLGCAAFGDRAAALPGALDSLDLAARHWAGPADKLVGPDASRAALIDLGQRGALQRYRLIHLASHAQLGATGGLLAHIKLADDDILLDELLQLQIRAALVVLAACEGGAAETLPGEEAMGLTHALLAAGARAVLASRWPIYAGGTLALLDQFYAALAHGEDAALALARAQRALIAAEPGDDQGALLPTPFIWGGFALTAGRYAPLL